ncbi:MAG: class I SAM-dependent methyltransferase [Paracoccaceae bacterium]|nr:class I SAM-dependent methyltransferase [Paracoccaceae bacterium]
MAETKATRLKSDRPSKTAEMVAAVRALHTRRASPPLIRDEMALSMCGPFWRAVVTNRALNYVMLKFVLRKVVAIVPVIYTRARFGEDCLEAAVRDGLRQFVIIGAGYDTTAMRRRDLAERLTVFELDHPATQTLKFRRMADAGIAKPDNVRYVASDLTEESVFNALERSGFDARIPAMFSWFGVTYYLERDTVRGTLASIADNCAPGSSILFDYLASLDSVAPEFRALHQDCGDFVARRGEPWLSDFDPPALADFLTPIGFEVVENIEPDQVSDRYPADHQGLIYPPLMGLCRARLPET